MFPGLTGRPRPCRSLCDEQASGEQLRASRCLQSLNLRLGPGVTPSLLLAIRQPFIWTEGSGHCLAGRPVKANRPQGFICSSLFAFQRQSGCNFSSRLLVWLLYPSLLLLPFSPVAHFTDRLFLFGLFLLKHTPKHKITHACARARTRTLTCTHARSHSHLG